MPLSSNNKTSSTLYAAIYPLTSDIKNDEESSIESSILSEDELNSYWAEEDSDLDSEADQRQASSTCPINNQLWEEESTESPIQWSDLNREDDDLSDTIEESECEDTCFQGLPPEQHDGRLRRFFGRNVPSLITASPLKRITEHTRESSISQSRARQIWESPLFRKIGLTPRDSARQQRPSISLLHSVTLISPPLSRKPKIEESKTEERPVVKIENLLEKLSCANSGPTATDKTTTLLH